MKKLVILSANTGQGHNACAAAVKGYAEEQGWTVDVVDALRFVSPRFSHAVSHGHSFMYRHVPKLFELGYSYSDEHRKPLSENSVEYRLYAEGAEKMRSYLQQGGYDAALCVHFMSAIMLTIMQKKTPLDIRTAFLSTDHDCCPGIENTDLDYYFLSDESTVSAFAAAGIAREKLVVSGIPVQEKYRSELTRAEAKRRLGIAAEKKHLIIMCGSMGCGPMAEIVRDFAEDMPEGVEISVLCGNNRLLRDELRAVVGRTKGIYITGYSSDIPLYLSSADLYLTKPGGISTAEAAEKQLPMVFVNAVAGCEEYNLKYYVNHGAAATADSPKALATLCRELLADDERREAMSAAFPETVDASVCICRTLSSGLAAKRQQIA